MIWLPPPNNLTLTPDKVHVWRQSLDCSSEEIEKLAKTLDVDERIRAEKFYFPQHRQRFTVARGTLRCLLGRYLQVPPEELQFEYSSRGKPRLAANWGGNWLQFNVSHSLGLAIYGLTRDRRLGIDLEYLRPLAEAGELAKRFYSGRESAALNALPPQEREKAFLRAWTAKEAYLKAVGEGLGGGLEQVEVSFLPETPLGLLSIGGDGQAASGWRLLELIPHPDYTAAIAVEGQDWQLECWQELKH